MMQNVGIPLRNYFTKSWNSIQNNAAKQMHRKFKLENTKNNDFKNLYLRKKNLNVFELLSLATNS
jgi:hypothetical protein